MTQVESRWTRLSKEHLEGEVRPGIHAHLVSPKLWHQSFARLKPQCFPDTARIKLPQETQVPLAGEIEKMVKSFEHHLVLTESPQPPQDAGEAIGVYTGYHAQGRLYWMFTSAVAPSHQRKGIYAALLNAVMGYGKAAGVSALLSQHRADNNPILIAKLKAGFLISSFKISGPGLTVELALPLRAGLEQAHRFRVKAETELAQMLRSKMLEVDDV